MFATRYQEFGGDDSGSFDVDADATSTKKGPSPSPSPTSVAASKATVQVNANDDDLLPVCDSLSTPKSSPSKRLSSARNSRRVEGSKKSSPRSSSNRSNSKSRPRRRPSLDGVSPTPPTSLKRAVSQPERPSNANKNGSTRSRRNTLQIGRSEEEERGEEEFGPRTPRRSSSMKKVRSIRRSKSATYGTQEDISKLSRGSEKMNALASPHRKLHSKRTSFNHSPSSASVRRRTLKVTGSIKAGAASTTTKRKPPPQARDLILDNGSDYSDEESDSRKTKATTDDMGGSMHSVSSRSSRRTSASIKQWADQDNNQRRINNNMDSSRNSIQRASSFRTQRKDNDMDSSRNSIQRAASFRTQRKNLVCTSHLSLQLQRASSFRNPRRDNSSSMQDDSQKDLFPLPTTLKKAASDALDNSSRSMRLRKEGAHNISPYENDKNKDQVPETDMGYGVPFFSDEQREDINVSMLAKMVVELQREVRDLRRELATVKSQQQQQQQQHQQSCPNNSDQANNSRSLSDSVLMDNRPMEGPRLNSPYHNIDDSDSETPE